MACKGLSRRNACIVFTIILVILLAGIAIVPIINMFLMYITSVCISAAILYYCCNCKNTKQIKQSHDVIIKDAESNVSIQKIEHDMDSSPTPNDNYDKLLGSSTKAKKKRLYYLDNLKSILTAIVVLHHITCSFNGQGWIYMFGYYYNPFLIFGSTLTTLNQSYFMCLFFFISAYFTPSSYDKKGTFNFMSDKFKRLGIPFCIYLFILGPALDLFIAKVAIKRHTDHQYSYGPDPGPCWFLAWLLFFNICYVLINIDENIPYLVVKIPSLLRIIIYGALLGIVQMAVFALVPGGFVFMPITIGSLPFDILFFISGVVAKHNGWLSQLSSFNVTAVRILTVVCFLIMSGLITYAYLVDIAPIFPDKNASETDCDTPDLDMEDLNVIIVAVLLYIVAGVCCMIFSVALLQFTESFCNFTNKYTKFLSQSAYTVYLIHPWIITPITWTFAELLHYFGGPKMMFCHDNNASRTHFGHNGLVWLGWIYTVVLSLIVVWPLAWCIRRIPGFNKII